MRDLANRKSAKGMMISASCFALAIASGARVALAGPPALPLGGSVVAGSASILQSGPASTLIVQKSKNAVINWQDFSVGAGAGVTFQQPDSASITLNRVTGPDASAVNGSLLANGQVWMINRNGILFGPGSHVDVGGLIATTSDMKDSDFLSGQYNFGIASANADAAVVNQGSIKAATGGSVLLSGSRVKNQGLIQARLGHVVLGGADAFSVSFDGDNLLQYQITAPVSQAPADSQGSSALVSNSGVISAQGGSVLMTARAARGVVDNVINTTGLIQASSVSVHNGEVVLDAGEDGTVAVSGTIDVSGRNSGESGGSIAVRGKSIAVADDASLNASGDAGGGTILIGGKLPDNLPGGGAAQNVAIGKAVIAADATGSGKGGTITIASSGAAVVAAAISAKGVDAGGMVETSGHDLTVTSDAHIDTSAAAGAGGMWLLDPVNVVVDPALASNIVGNLATTNVTISASNDISVNAPVVYTSTNALSFLAGHNLTINADVQNGGTGSVLAAAGWDGVTGATNILTTPGSYGGNGGSMLIGGGGAGGGVAFGSRDGATMVAAQDLTITGTNSYAQLGYHGAPFNATGTGGNISVVLGGQLTVTGGNTSNASFAQIGYGGYQSIGDFTGDISISAHGSVNLAGGTALNAYAQIGNGGLQSVGNNSSKVFIASGGNVAISTGASIKAGGAGDALVLAAAGNFINQAGSTALSVTFGGRWLLFLASPANNVAGGLTASPFYNRPFNFLANSYLPVTSAGSRFVYAQAPMVTVTVGSGTKVYGSANPALSATVTGGLPGDAPAGVFTGAPTISTTATATSSVGNYAIVGNLGTLSSDFNYGFQFVNGALRIDPATITASLTGLVQKSYDGTSFAALTAANYQLSGVLPGDSVTLNNPASSNYSDKNVGVGKIVSVGGLTLSGPSGGNYLLSSSNASAAIGTITPLTVVASLTGQVQKPYDGTNFAPLTTANYQLLGVLPGEIVTLNNPASGNYNDKNVGIGKTVSVGGLTLLGPGSGNYLLSSPSASAAIGTITPLTVVASLVGPVQKIFDGTTSAVLISGNYDLSGALAGDDVSLNNPVLGSYDSKYLGTGKTVSVGGLALLGSDGGNYVLVSTTASADIGIISATLITNAIGDSYTSGAAGTVSPGSAPAGGAQPVSDATSDTGAAGGDSVQSDSTAFQIGKSLGGSAVQHSSTVLIDGLLRQFSGSPGSMNPRGVPPYGQVYSSWGNEAFWQ
jgi:filamentous hemagglutinin family protein